MAEGVFASWWRTRRAMRENAAQLAQRRQKAWQALQPSLARTPALASFAGRPLAEFPITDIAGMRADYGAWNSLGLGASELTALAECGGAGGLSAGWSTGTSGGERGLFVTTPVERADYIGQSLARLLPPSALLRKQRLALHLRAGNDLYSDARRRRFAFAHIPLDESVTRGIDMLVRFRPTILIAPPHRLLAFAAAGLQLPGLRHLFCGSEPVSETERAAIARHFGIPLREIYQATEGFLGATCYSGKLHLNDHALEIECEPVTGTAGFRPVITDLRRRSQPIVRLRGDDYLEWAGEPCRCGFAGRVIRPVQGRVGDIWQMEGRTITPPQVVEAVEDALGTPVRWQAVGSRHDITLRLAPDCSDRQVEQARLALSRLAGKPVTLDRTMPEWSGSKRRKVVWNG